MVQAAAVALLVSRPAVLLARPGLDFRTDPKRTVEKRRARRPLVRGWNSCLRNFVRLVSCVGVLYGRYTMSVGVSGVADRLTQPTEPVVDGLPRRLGCRCWGTRVIASAPVP